MEFSMCWDQGAPRGLWLLKSPSSRSASFLSFRAVEKYLVCKFLLFRIQFIASVVLFDEQKTAPTVLNHFYCESPTNQSASETFCLAATGSVAVWDDGGTKSPTHIFYISFTFYTFHMIIFTLFCTYLGRRGVCMCCLVSLSFTVLPVGYYCSNASDVALFGLFVYSSFFISACFIKHFSCDFKMYRLQFYAFRK